MNRSDLNAEVVERINNPGAFGVEAIDEDGSVYMAIFTGPHAQARASEYAEAKFRASDGGGVQGEK